MARNNNKLTRRKKKIEPSVLTMQFTLPQLDPGTSGRFYIDLSQCASLLNRRFYRQGINWAVSQIKLASDYTGFVWTSKLPTTWVMSNAWEKGFRAWQRMNNDALEETSVKPKFLDFKIFANANHHAEGFENNLLPLSMDNTVGVVGYNYVEAVPGEWVNSKIHVPAGLGAAAATNEFDIIAVGENFPGAGASGNDGVSLIDGYSSSRSLPDVLDPNVPADAADATGAQPDNWMAALFSEGTIQDDQVLTDMISENNIAPYPFENDGLHADTMYPGGANQLNGLMLHDMSLITGTTIGGETYIPGGMFPCGLIEILIGSTAENTGGQLQIELVPGDHRGYLCEPMTEM